MNRRIKMIDKAVPALGMGCWAIGGEWDFLGVPAGWGKSDDKESIRAISAAWDNGIRLFDTAATYGCGHSEKLLGQALKGKRDQAVIVSKFGFDVNDEQKTAWNYGDDMAHADVAPHVKEDCEKTLKRLGCDYLDILLFHIWDYDNKLGLLVQKELEDLVQEGKIRTYGWSTDDVKSVKSWSKGPHFSSIMNNYHIAADAPELMSLCEELDITALNRGPLAMGFLTGKYNKDSKFSSTDVRSAQWVDEGFKNPVLNKLDQLRDVLTSGGRSMAQGALAWIWAKSGAALPTPGIRTAAQAEDLAGALALGPLSEHHLKQIEQIMGR